MSELQTPPREQSRIGRVLAGRYRLVAPIGSGACAAVYLAEDQTLARAVAVKVLHDVLARDDAFLAKFRDEARAAGALNHPNITAVFDWGEAEVPFLVMEHLSGGSLRRMLDAQRTLTAGQVLVVGLEAARGLDAAHQQGIVHRDIKPANLLFDGEGRLRVADFGLARALAEASSTEPTGAVMGTAKYASPEQARAEPVDGRSDVYSLALVLVEAFTGTAPFVAETSIATLMARVDQPIPTGGVPAPLQPVLEWAGRVDPYERPDASDLARALLAAASQIDRPEPLPIADLSLDAFSDDISFLRGAARVVDDPAGESALASPMEVVVDEPAARAARVWGRAQPGRRAAADRVAPYDFTREAEPDFIDLTGQQAQPRWRSKPAAAPARATRPRRALRVSVVAAAVALVLAGVARFGFGIGASAPAPAAVPDLSSKPFADVQPVAEANGWKVEKVDEPADNTVAGQVVSQSPVAGTPLAAGAVLTVRVAAGPPLLPVPGNLTGKPLEQAKVALFYSGFVVGEVQRQDSDQKADTVLSLAPNTPSQLPKGSPVALVVSAGKAGKVAPATTVPKSSTPTTATTPTTARPH